MGPIQRDELRRLMEDSTEGYTLVDVLPAEQFAKGRLPGAVNVPHDEHFRANIQRLIPNKDAKVIVYCWNRLTSASKEAARDMEEMGYTNVFVYEEGKHGWHDAGLPIESPAGARRASHTDSHPER